MTPPLTLDSVRAAFEQWRGTRHSPRTAVPRALQQQALALLPHYTQTQVLATLKINHTTLKRWRQTDTPSSAQTFVALPTGQADCLPSLQITLRNRHGDGMTIVGALSGEQLLSLAGGLLRPQEITS